jgi:hypothetical protein
MESAKRNSLSHSSRIVFADAVPDPDSSAISSAEDDLSVECDILLGNKGTRILQLVKVNSSTNTIAIADSACREFILAKTGRICRRSTSSSRLIPGSIAKENGKMKRDSWLDDDSEFEALFSQD